MIMEIPKSEDWRTDTDDPMINAFRELMIENNQYQDDPYVGIFWYDVNEHDLFAVCSTMARDTQFSDVKIFDEKARTCRQLHYRVWEKNKRKTNGQIYKQDYTLVPRGRVFELESGKFIVCCGKWIEKHPEAKELIIDEFQLPEDNTEFKVDIHWEIGHGWSDDAVSVKNY